MKDKYIEIKAPEVIEEKKEVKQCEEDLNNLDVKTLSLKWRIVLALVVISYIIFSLYMDFLR